MNMERPKAGKVAVVTGVAGGIAGAFAERLAADGAIVVGVDLVTTEGLEERLRHLGAADALFLAADIADEHAVERIAHATLDRFGRCDILLNNAGVVPRAPLAEVTLADWRRTMAINVESMFMLSRAFVPGMVERGWGRVVNTTSAVLGEVIDGFTSYMATKGAVVGFTRALANETGPHGVTVNCIAPALTRVPRTEAEMPNPAIFEMIAQAQAIKKVATPIDYVGAMSFLTSDDSAFMTGQTMIVNGGLLKAL